MALYAPTAAGCYCLCKSGYVGLLCEVQNMTETKTGELSVTILVAIGYS